MTILFAAGVSEAFDELPDKTKERAAHSIDLLTLHPRIYQIRLTAIIPAAMRRA